MIRKIGLQFAFIIFASLVAFVIGSSLIVQSNLNQITELNLNNYLTVVSNEYESGMPLTDIIAKYRVIDDYLRITIIDAQGNVLADGLSDTSENHLTRPEFVHPGTVQIRQSATLNREMMYLATQFADGNYLRVAIPTSSILPFLNAFIGISVLIAFGIAIIAGFGSFAITKQLIVPLRETADSLNAVAKGKYTERLPLEKTEELNRIINEINDISSLISHTIASLNIEKRKRDFILDHMDQGLCVLDATGRIVMINRFVKELFGYHETEDFNKDYLYLFRDKTIQSAIKTALDGKTSTATLFFVSDRYYSVMASVIDKDWNQSKSVVLIFSDITMIKNLEILKRDFFVNASHELKSPLTSIIGASDLIANGLAKDEAETVDLAKRIVQEAHRMNNLVMDMLNLSKYENNLLSKGEEMIDLSEVVLDVVNSLKPNATLRNIRIETDLQTVLFRADNEQMIQLVRNLVDNSIKYGVDNGWIGIRLFATDVEYKLEVADDGIGIPKTDQTRVFERFYRADKARSKKTGGTGLGLAIVKHICLIYQARIELESELGKGTKITICFPIE